MCVPPDTEFMCQRSATIIKMALVTTEMRKKIDLKHNYDKQLKESIEEAKKQAMVNVSTLVHSKSKKHRLITLLFFHRLI